MPSSERSCKGFLKTGSVRTWVASTQHTQVKSALLRKTREPEHKSCGAGHSKELGFVVSAVKMSLRAVRTSLGAPEDRHEGNLLENPSPWLDCSCVVPKMELRAYWSIAKLPPCVSSPHTWFWWLLVEVGMRKSQILLITFKKVVRQMATSHNLQVKRIPDITGQ